MSVISAMRVSDAKNSASGSGSGRQPADVGRDRREHVVAGEHHAELRVVQAEVVVGVAGRVHGHPLAARQFDRLPVDERPRRLWRGERRVHRFTGREDAVEELLRRPAATSAPRCRFGEVPLHRRGAIVGRVDVEGGGILVSGEIGPVEHRAERLVRDDVGAGFVAQSHGTAEVVGVRVGDDDRVDVVDGEPGAPEAVDEVVPRFRAGEAGIDDGDAPFVLQHVAVHVAEPRHVDRQLRPQHSGGDLGDLGRRLFLLLSRLARRVGLAEAGCMGVVVVIVSCCMDVPASGASRPGRVAARTCCPIRPVRAAPDRSDERTGPKD